jgi:hypothetical protein
MDWKKHRMLIGSVLLLGLVATLVTLQKRRDAEYAAGAETEESPLPAIVRNTITSVEIRRPEQPVVRLEKSGELFRVAAPVTSPADVANVSSLLDKLVGLEFVSIASRSRSSHVALEVDAAHSIHVIAKAGNRTAIDLHIGVYRGGHTMVRLEGSNDVLAVSGSVRFAFARELHEWRDRAVTEITPADVRIVTFASDAGTFRFERNADGEFVPAAGQAAIPRYDATKVDGIVTSLARLRATDFGMGAGPLATFATPRSTVTLHVQRTAGEDGGVGEAEDVVLLLGGAREETNDVYVQRQGNPTVFVGPGFLSDRMRPTAAAFQADIPTDAGVPAAPEPDPNAMPTEMLGGGAGGGQIPPEVLRQLMQQAQQQGGGGPPPH